MILNGRSVSSTTVLQLAQNLFANTGKPVNPGDLGWAAFQLKRHELGGDGYEKLRAFLRSAGIPVQTKRIRRWAKRPNTTENLQLPKYSLATKAAAPLICQAISAIVGDNEDLAVEILSFAISKTKTRA